MLKEEIVMGMSMKAKDRLRETRSNVERLALLGYRASLKKAILTTPEPSWGSANQHTAYRGEKRPIHLLIRDKLGFCGSRRSQLAQLDFIIAYKYFSPSHIMSIEDEQSYEDIH